MYHTSFDWQEDKEFTNKLFKVFKLMVLIVNNK